MQSPNDFPLKREVCAKLLADPETTATTLHLILLTEFKDLLYGDEEEGPMDPVLTWSLARENFSVTIPEENENKINALMHAISTDGFYEDPVQFVAVCLALYSGDLGDMVTGVMEEATLPEMLWGVFEVALNRDDDVDFSPAVLRMIDQETREEIEEGDYEFPFYERQLSARKTQILVELRQAGASEEILSQIRLFDDTPIHDEEGNLVSPTGELLSPSQRALAEAGYV